MKIKITDFLFRLNEREDKVSLQNNNHSKVGVVEVLYYDQWFPISNIGLNFDDIKLICQNFDFDNGYIFIEKDYINVRPVLFTINCTFVKIFRECKIENFLSYEMNRFYNSHLLIKCMKRGNRDCSKNVFHKNCDLINVFMRSCYCLYISKDKLISYDESQNICNNKLVGISYHQEARFLYSMIHSFLLRNSPRLIKNLSIPLLKYKLPFG